LFLARRSDGSVRVKLLDFGISKIAATPGRTSDGGMTSTQALMGSPLYMAPEQMRSSKGVDARADIWSMGVILYEMVGGQSPFNGDTLPMVCARIMAETPDSLRVVRRDVPPALEAVVMRCLEKDAHRRYQDVAALAQALAPFGPPEARMAAERIGRVVRRTQPSSADLVGDAVATTTVNSVQPEVAQTAATFGTAASTNITRRSNSVPLVAGAAVLVVAGIVAVLATRGGSSEASKTDSPSTPVTGLGVSPPPVSTSPGPVHAAELPPAASESLAPTEPVAPAVVTPAAVVVAPAASSAATASSPPTTHAHAKPKPAAVSTAKPAATSAFGGRD
jgi:serine/threonine-protein kinase